MYNVYMYTFRQIDRCMRIYIPLAKAPSIMGTIGAKKLCGMTKTCDV